MSTTARIGIAIGVVIFLVLFLIVIFGDGGGGPIIVIDPGDEIAAAGAARAATWTVTCGGKPAEPVAPTKSPAIPGRWLNKHGIEKMSYKQAGQPIKWVDTLKLEIEYQSETNVLTIERKQKGAPVWSFGPAGKQVEVKSSGKGRRSWPADMLGPIKSVDGIDVKEIEEINIYHNKQWGFPWCN